MKGMGGEGEDCPFEFNFDPATFKVGDTVSYKVRQPGSDPGSSFLLEV